MASMFHKLQMRNESRGSGESAVLLGFSLPIRQRHCVAWRQRAFVDSELRISNSACIIR